MTSKSRMDRLWRDLDREIPHSERSLSKLPEDPPEDPPAPQTKVIFFANVTSKPLTWLWPRRIPLGHLTLLDAAPGCDPSLFALTLAACVSSGSPLPDGTTIQKGWVIILAPYDSPAATVKPRLEAAGANLACVLLFHPLVEDASRKLSRTRSITLPDDLDSLATRIRFFEPRLIIFDPASAIPGLSRCLPALSALAHETNSAILLTRVLREPPADPLHSPGPTSPLLEAARARLLLTPDPADERHHLLLTTRHLLSSQPPVLAYHTVASEAGTSTIHWLGERDPSHLVRLSTGPLRSPQRQAILRFLQNSASPRGHNEILEAACYDDKAGRKMIWRMKLAGELVSTARGLYTTPNHPCLAQSTDEIPPVTNVTSVSRPSTATPNAITPSDRPVRNVPNPPSSQNLTNGNSPPGDIPLIPDVPAPLMAQPESHSSSQALHYEVQ